MKKQYNPNLSRVFITGGAGFIGSHLVDFLLAQNHHVIVIDNLSTGRLANLKDASQQPHFSFFSSCVCHFPWEKHLRPNDKIIHLAATVGVKKVYESALETAENNHRMIECLINASKSHKNKIIYASTSEVYGTPLSKEGSNETDTLDVHVLYKGRSAYTLSKLYGEMMCLSASQEWDIPITVVRLFNTIGTRQSAEYGMVVPNFIRQAAHDAPLSIYGDGQQTRSFCCVYDTVAALAGLLDLETAAGQIYNIGNPEEITIEELADYVRGYLGSSSVKIFKELPPERTGAADSRARKPNIRKIKMALGWQPKFPWQEAVNHIIHALNLTTA
jgi:UDP-glucose 4-epimerase